ncbi:MAG: TIR domain-containing protein [Gemmatimonadaceae bacterium]|nr:TIR domain-containing protein [Gemmatimonadaceae bacterium]
MVTRKAFISYTHADNDASMNGIITLAQDIGREFRLLSGEQLDIRSDGEILSWGDTWRAELESAIAQAAFFIPFVTAGFFLSVECRREFELFLRVASDLGRPELVMPILWAPVRDLVEENPDPLVARVAKTQYEDWTRLRLVDRTSSDYKIGLNALSSAIVDRAEGLGDPESISASMAALHPPPETYAGDDEPGPLDLIAENEGLLTDLPASVNTIAETLGKLSEVTVRFTPMIQRTSSQGQTSAKVVVINEYAKALEPLADELEANVRDYKAKLDGTDLMLGPMIQYGLEEQNRASARELAIAILGAAESTASFTNSAEDARVSVAQTENVTRSMRGPSKKIQTALLNIRDTRPIVESWAEQARGLLTELDKLEAS